MKIAKKKKQKIECSKKILLFSDIVALSLTLCMVIGTFVGVDVSPLENITLASWGEVTAAHSFYYIKSRTENRLKILKSLPDELKEQIDINQFIN